MEDGRTVFDAAQYPPVAHATIASGAYQSVTLTPLAGLLQCGKYLLLRLMNSMVLEFSLAPAAQALAPVAEAVNGVANNSTQFELQQCELQFSTVRLDSALEAGFSSMMLSGRALQLNLRTIMSQQAIIPAAAVEFQAHGKRVRLRFSHFGKGGAGAIAGAVADCPLIRRAHRFGWYSGRDLHISF